MKLHRLFLFTMILAANLVAISTTSAQDTKSQLIISNDTIPSDDPCIIDTNSYTITSSSLGLIIGTCSGKKEVETSSMEPSPAAQMLMFPNPVADVLCIRSPQIDHGTIADIDGRIVASFTKSDETLRVTVASLPTGTYIVTIGSQRMRMMKQ